jgi:acyl carrier protein
MTKNEVREAIFEILHRTAPEADLNRVDPNENLREALDIDSFDFLNVLVALNEKFRVNIPESDYRRVSTVNGMIVYLSKYADTRLPLLSEVSEEGCPSASTVR